jgi:phosphoribosyl 1,2-cyclic phosphodiesterase
MKVKIWGCRGSIPSPGHETLIYGGESTCVEVISDSGESLIIDAGSGIRKLGNALLKNNDNRHLTILFTHAHWDHLIGFPFFRPAYSPEFTISLCGGPIPQGSIMDYVSHQMEPPYFPVDMSEMKAEFVTGCHCDKDSCDHCPGEGIKTIKCHSVPLCHPNGGYGFKFISGGKTFCFLPDNELHYAHSGGLSEKQYAEFCRGAELLIHDAQYTDDEYLRTRSWGHSRFRDAVDLAIEAGVKRLGLFHHDPDRSDEELKSQVEIWQKYITDKGEKLECFACAEGMAIEL